MILNPINNGKSGENMNLKINDLTKQRLEHKIWYAGIEAASEETGIDYRDMAAYVASDAAPTIEDLKRIDAYLDSPACPVITLAMRAIASQPPRGMVSQISQSIKFSDLLNSKAFSTKIKKIHNATKKTLNETNM